MRLIKVKRIKPVQPPPVTKPVRDPAAKAAFADHLRNNPTQSEEIFGQLLDKLRISYKFQPIICGYIPDFYFPKRKLIIELDGKCHDAQKPYDRARDAHLRKQGYKVYRIASKRMFYNVDGVEQTLRRLFNLDASGEPKRKRTKTRSKVRKALAATPDPLYEEFLMRTQGL